MEKTEEQIIEELRAARPVVNPSPVFVSALRQQLEQAKNPVPIHMSYLRSIAGAVIVLVVIVGGVALMSRKPNNSVTPIANVTYKPSGGLTAFKSAQEFQDYMEQSATANSYGGMGGGIALRTDSIASQKMGIGAVPAPEAFQGEQSIQVDRYSQTNVQVLGIDEPDSVKTNGKELYWNSATNRYYYDCIQPMGIEEGVISNKMAIAPRPPCQPQGNGVSVIDITHPSKLAELSKLQSQGDILLDGHTAMVLSYNVISAYDVGSPAAPKQTWTLDLKNKQVIASRLYGHSLYLVLGDQFSTPCPLKPIAVGGSDISIPCGRIYHPRETVPGGALFHVFKINTADGAVKDSVSFAGSSQQSVVYMSTNAIYTTYTFNADIVPILSDFLHSKGQNLLPSSVVAKIDKLVSYDISSNAKQVELSLIVDNYIRTLDSDAQITLQNNLTNSFTDYSVLHKREFETTGIVRIGLNDLSIAATGSVPGHPLNQFSLDEYNGTLRIATTSGGGWFPLIGGQIAETTSDVYTLDNSLAIKGAVKDLGQGEKIYAVRFIGNRGYVVTFKQTDPFYVLDLSDQNNPQLKGQLKIPGYSSYLDPLTDDRILGVGMENNRVKLSLFDVSDPQNPREVSHYSLSEYWTDVSNNHHAFLQDAKHGIFFIPGGQSGYIFGYAGDDLRLVKTVGNIQARRAVYVNDNLFITSDSSITVLDENSWDVVSTFVINNYSVSPMPYGVE